MRHHLVHHQLVFIASSINESLAANPDAAYQAQPTRQAASDEPVLPVKAPTPSFTHPMQVEVRVFVDNGVHFSFRGTARDPRDARQTIKREGEVDCSEAEYTMLTWEKVKLRLGQKWPVTKSIGYNLRMIRYC